MGGLEVESHRRLWGVDTIISVPFVDESGIHEMVSGYEKCGHATVWRVNATAVRAYRAGAIAVAATEFARLVREHGLTKLIAVITKPTVRMGTSVVAMTMRAAGAPLDIIVVPTVADADKLLAKKPS